jgi:predicted transposase/invertase (TIGR01784 family)
MLPAGGTFRIWRVEKKPFLAYNKCTMSNKKHIRFDWAIKKLLRSKANFSILEGFLSELLREDVKILEILDSEGNKETDNDKFNRVDILVKDSSEQIIIIEIQNTRELDYFYKVLYNTSKVITEHMTEGASYKEVKKVITVSVVYFALGQGEDYVYHGNTTFRGIHKNDILQLSEKQKQMFRKSSLSEVFPNHYIIKTNDFNDIARDSLDQWIYFLKNSEIKDEFNAKGLAEAREKLKEINLPPEELRAYRRYLDQLHDEASIAETIKFDEEFATRKARQEGRQEGLEEGWDGGRENKAKETAKLMKQDGEPLEKISKYTGLSPEEIQNL